MQIVLAVLVALVNTLVSLDAAALPIFARQTGHNCIACHAGGQFPELTPYGRLFKLTAFTIGKRATVPYLLSWACLDRPAAPITHQLDLEVAPGMARRPSKPAVSSSAAS